MIKKGMFALLCSVTGIIQASSYPGDKSYEPVMRTIYHHQSYYDCNWADKESIRYYINQLKYYQIQTVVYPHALRIVIPDYLLFVSLTHIVKYDAQNPFYVLLGFLQQLPYTKIQVIGFTDNIATKDVNISESMEQAQKLSGYLWMYHIPNMTQTLDYRGAGESDPIANNKLVDGMAQNRRVEVIVKLPR